MGKQGNSPSASGLLFETFLKIVTCHTWPAWAVSAEVCRTLEGTCQTKYLSAHTLQMVLILVAIVQ